VSFRGSFSGHDHGAGVSQDTRRCLLGTPHLLNYTPNQNKHSPFSGAGGPCDEDIQAFLR